MTIDRLFAVRAGAMALTSAMMALFLIGPFVDVLIFESGIRWLGAYGVLLSVSLATTAIAVVLTFALFRLIGPKRTRLAAQIVAALIGGLFVIGLQIAAMFSVGTPSRFAFLHSKYVLSRVPGIDSIIWWPARAAVGDAACVAFVVCSGILLFLGVVAFHAPRFAALAIAAAGGSHGTSRDVSTRKSFRVGPATSSLRRKERMLILRDPWLLSQSLMQLLYLAPPALLLSRSFAGGPGAPVILVPVLIMAAGQLAGGLAWLTVSGEDAPDLVHSAPVAASRLLRAKIEAVLQCIGIVFFPFVLGLALISPAQALVAVAGIVAATVSSSAVQLWFRTQSQRSQFRRRHTSSRIATLAEAFVSITWAAAGVIAASGSWLALPVVVLALLILLAVKSLSPARAAFAPA